MNKQILCIDVSFMLYIMMERYAFYLDALSLHQTNSLSVDERNAAILKDSEICVDHCLAYIYADISALRQLTEKLRLLEEAKRNHRAILSPISTLPLEILSGIFFYVTSDPTDIFDPNHLTCAISKICQLCRSAIRVTALCPDIWTKLLIGCESQDGVEIHEDGALLMHHYLGQINASWKSRRLMYPSIGELQKTIWPRLTMYAERWRFHWNGWTTPRNGTPRWRERSTTRMQCQDIGQYILVFGKLNIQPLTT
ncbi:uncharacterized protein BT62DRAFT_1020613 [Guyanagaster necrorhizus]|uniref:F-box domain-containing protein n=1 Tax=Guyanagaster necrorhizus TaxID=856835 RepID=A0A9P7VVR7_9AGAR|nr:uncharacterized protein BT62DRAFT_1020613 [Guyanagaster necrorhizus MCA 3950]KAG7447059.1 hypothetical protein BT62DRAFT_1020613 [Guyanagaster necrorhizus MCA 3950]